MSTVLDDKAISQDADAPARPRPLALTDAQWDIVQRAAEPLHPRDRGAYLEAVAELLREVEIGDGAVARAAREALVSKYR
jgi:hypothetical protein